MTDTRPALPARRRDAAARATVPVAARPGQVASEPDPPPPPTREPRRTMPADASTLVETRRLSDKPFIPRADSAAAAWFRSFRDDLTARPDVYRAEPAEIERVRLACDGFLAAMDALDEYRTPARTFVKDRARADAEAACRATAARLRDDAAVPASALLVIGVRRRDAKKGGRGGTRRRGRPW